MEIYFKDGWGELFCRDFHNHRAGGSNHDGCIAFFIEGFQVRFGLDEELDDGATLEPTSQLDGCVARIRSRLKERLKTARSSCSVGFILVPKFKFVQQHFDHLISLKMINFSPVKCNLIDIDG